MTSRARLTDGEIAERLRALSGWQLREGRLRRELTFNDFVDAFSYLTALALVAERLNHHPAFENVYNRVILMLWTHDAGGLTALDFEFAAAAERLLARYSLHPG